LLRGSSKDYGTSRSVEEVSDEIIKKVKAETNDSNSDTAEGSETGSLPEQNPVSTSTFPAAIGVYNLDNTSLLPSLMLPYPFFGQIPTSEMLRREPLVWLANSNLMIQSLLIDNLLQNVRLRQKSFP